MSNNFSNYDFLFNVEKGKKLTQEQLLKNYQDFVKNDKEKANSVFGADFTDMIGDIFEVLNTEKLSKKENKNNEEEYLDDKEIAALRAYFNDNDNDSTISANDLNALNKQISEKIGKKYSTDGATDPEQMYKQALKKANGHIENSSYLLDLSNDIDALNSMIDLRKLNSENIINKYRDEIDQLIKSNLDEKSKDDYEKLKAEADEKQKQISQTEAKIKSNKQKIDEIKQEQLVTESQIAAMLKENKPEASEQIDKGNLLVSSLKSKITDLVSENTKLSSDLIRFTSELDGIKTKMAQMQEKALREDELLKTKISGLEAKIAAEEESCKNDIDGYNSRIKILKSARTYATPKVFKTYKYTGGNVFASHRNDNAISFNELESKGLKYSSSKGQALANDVYSHRAGFTGHCAAYVKKGLRRTGLVNLGSCNGEGVDDAMRASGTSNFIEVKITSREQLRSLPSGCVVVYEKGAAGYNARYGHVEVTMGNGTAVSDGVTHNMRYSENMSVFVPVEPKSA